VEGGFRTTRHRRRSTSRKSKKTSGETTRPTALRRRVTSGRGGNSGLEVRADRQLPEGRRTTPQARRAAGALGASSDPVSALTVGLPQHADEHRPERPVLLAVDQQLGEGPPRRVGRCPRFVGPGTLDHYARVRRRSKITVRLPYGATGITNTVNAQ
jgi:hypothetical protein